MKKKGYIMKTTTVRKKKWIHFDCASSFFSFENWLKLNRWKWGNERMSEDCNEVFWTFPIQYFFYSLFLLLTDWLHLTHFFAQLICFKRRTKSEIMENLSMNCNGNFSRKGKEVKYEKKSTTDKRRKTT